MTPAQLEVFAMVYGFHELTEREREQVRALRASREAAKKRRTTKKRRKVKS
jgi:hypothetical protein